MDTKHTKGPWYASRLSEGVWIIKNEAFDSYIALTHNREGVHADANAHLIAAAPDLLEALRKVSAALEAVYESEMEWTGEWDMLPPDALEMAKAAIRKAEGK